MRFYCYEVNFSTLIRNKFYSINMGRINLRIFLRLEKTLSELKWRYIGSIIRHIIFSQLSRLYFGAINVLRFLNHSGILLSFCTFLYVWRGITFMNIVEIILVATAKHIFYFKCEDISLEKML